MYTCVLMYRCLYLYMYASLCICIGVLKRVWQAVAASAAGRQAAFFAHALLVGVAIQQLVAALTPKVCRCPPGLGIDPTARDSTPHRPSGSLP